MISSGGEDPLAPSGMQPPGSSGIAGGSAPDAGGMGGGAGMNSGGSAGIFRLFGNGLAGDISWLLAFALIGVLAWVRRPVSLSLKGLEEAGFMSEKGLTLIAMLLWLIPGLLYFSFTSGFWHDYYLATIAPPLAGLVGIGAVGLYRNYVSGSRAGWLLVIAVLVSGLLQVLFLSYDAEWAGPLLPIILIGTLVSTGLLAWMQVKKTAVLVKYRTQIIAVAIGILFIAPLVWSCTPVMNGASNLPTAGPQSSRGGGGGMNSGMTGGAIPPGMAGTGTGTSGMADSGGLSPDQMSISPASGDGDGGFTGNRTDGFSAMSGGPQGRNGDDTSTSQLVEYLLAHTTNETWILAVPSSHTGADIIIKTGKPVMCLGGFAGNDQVLNVTTIQDYIREGRVRFFQTGGSGGGGEGSSGIASWVSSHCTAVNLTDVAGAGGSPVKTFGGILYDCRGAAGTG